MDDLISVIMAEHKTNIFELKKSINSILNQTYTNLELIIIDDMTNEENRKYLNTLQSDNSNVHIITNIKNIGLAASLNRAIENSNGNYIFRMDTDDVAHLNRLESQLKILKKGYSITTARAIIIDENGSEIGRTKCLPFHNLFRKIQLYYLFRNSVIHPLIAAKKEVFREFKYDESIMFGQDFELWLRMSKKYKIFFDKNILIEYRMQQSVNKKKMLYQYINHMRVAIKYLGHNPIKKLGLYTLDKQYKRKLLKTLNLNSKELSNEIYKLDVKQ